MAAVGDEDIGGLDVAMNDALRVSGIERIGNFDCESEGRFGFERMAGNSLLQRGANPTKKNSNLRG